MREVVIVDAVRTPIGRYRGALKDVRPDDLGAMVIKGLIERNSQVPFNSVDDVIFGNANGAGEENRNVARMSLLLAGLPTSISGTTVNRLCGSGLDAVNFAARSILSGEIDIAIAGGTESMTRAPYVLGKSVAAFSRGDMALLDTTIGWRFVNQKLEEIYGADSMPKTAENVAKKYEIARSDQDTFAQKSQEKTKKAQLTGRFKDEIVPVVMKDKKRGTVTIMEDEHPRHDSSLENLEKLNALFENGTITAGNASGINDGASALLMMSAEKAKEFGLIPLVKYVYSATAGVEPSIMGIGPVKAVQKLMEKTGLGIDDFDLVELNEAFASQSLACIRELQLDEGRVNVNGGATALGHPLGASGVRILTTLIHEMKKRGAERGLATMCIGVGQGIATAVERYE